MAVGGKAHLFTSAVPVAVTAPVISVTAVVSRECTHCPCYWVGWPCCWCQDRSCERASMFLSKDEYYQLVERAARGSQESQSTLDLRRQISKLEQQLEHALAKQDREQTRADNALDALAGNRAGVAPVSPEPRSSLPEMDIHEEDPAEVEAILQDIKSKGSLETMMDRK